MAAVTSGENHLLNNVTDLTHFKSVIPTKKLKGKLAKVRKSYVFSMTVFFK